MEPKEWWMEELAKMRQRAEAAEAALAERDEPCLWTENEKGNFDTGCGEEFFYRGKFCFECGHPVEVAS